MAITWANRLEGTHGTQPNASTIAATGDAAASVNNQQLHYDNTFLLRGRVPIRFRTWYSGTTSGQIGIPAPSGPWTIRWYFRIPEWDDPVVISEYRTLLVLGDRAVAIRPTAANNVVLRLINPDNLAATPAGTDQGSPVGTNQTLRIEVSYNGSGTVTGRVFPGDSTGAHRFTEWSYTPTSSTLQLTGYRWRRYTTLQGGSTDANTGGLVTPYQEKLLAWDPNSLPQFGADGDFGNETQSATISFQNSRGLTADGVAGPETQSALDLAVMQGQSTSNFPPPVWMGAVTVVDEATILGPLDLHSADTDPMVATADLAVSVSDTTGHQGHLAATAQMAVQVSTQRTVSLQLAATADLSATPSKSVTVSTQPLFGFSQINVATDAQVTIPPPPPLVPTAMLLVYDPAGELRGEIPAPLAFDLSVVLNDIGSMTLTYPVDSPGHDLLLNAPFEVAFLINRGGDTPYTEPFDCRFIFLRRSFDLVDRTRVVRYTLASYGWMLRKARIFFPSASQPQNVESEREFVNRRPAGILRTLIDESKSRNNIAEMGTAFTNAADIDGTPWDHDPLPTITYPTGTDLLNILQTFSEENYFDWRFNGRSLGLYNINTGLARRLEDEIHLSNFSQASESHQELAFDDFAAIVGARSDRAAHRSIGGIITPLWWGRWEEFIDVQGSASHAQVTHVASRRAAYTAQPNKIQYLIRFPIRAFQHVPLLDYRPGDFVHIYPVFNPGPSAQVARRIHQISITYDADRILKTTVALGTPIYQPDIRRQRVLERLTNRGLIRGSGVR